MVHPRTIDAYLKKQGPMSVAKLFMTKSSASKLALDPALLKLGKG